MRLSFSSEGHIARLLAVISLLILLTGCSNNGSSPSSVTSTRPSSITPTRPSPITPTSSSSITPTSAPNLVPPLNASGSVTMDIAGLSIYSADGIQCPLGLGRVSPSDYLVLATDRLSYDSGELQQMETYVANAVYSDQSYSMPPPTALQWVPGGTFCNIDLQITNTGDSAIQIVSAGVKLQQDAQPNNYQYRLIDACSLVRTSSCRNVPYILPHCRAKVQLNSGSAGAVFDNTFTMSYQGPSSSLDQQCPAVLLQPKGTVILSIDLSSSSAAGIFSIVPELKLSNQTDPLQLDQMATTITFSDASQFTCYGLQGDTFIQVDQNARGVWCV